jgi:hypothetical protein
LHQLLLAAEREVQFGEGSKMTMHIIEKIAFLALCKECEDCGLKLAEKNTFGEIINSNLFQYHLRRVIPSASTTCASFFI